MMRPAAWLSAALLAAGVLTAGPAAVAAAAGPVLSVPPAGDHGFPFLSEARDLAGHGYTEQEFFLSGTATAYDRSGLWDDQGHWAVRAKGAADFRTRLLVRRPADPAAFNGTVVVEWLNDTGQLDIAPDWTYAHDELLNGYAWVGVSVQNVGVSGLLGLKTWDGARYRSLSHPGDAYSYDIFSQAGTALRERSGLDPLGGLRPARYLAAGESQSALRLATYVNTQARTAKAYDGYLIHSNAGFAAPLGDGPIDLLTPTARIRTDLAVPTLLLQTESDVALNSGARQPDSARVHTWEVAGTAHADAWMLSRSGETIEGSAGLNPIKVEDLCGQGHAPVNDGPGRFATGAAVAALARWSAGGPAPAVAVPLTVKNGALARDQVTGLALGGVRLPDVTVPTRTLSGQRGDGINGLICALFGSADPWNGDTDVWDRHNGDDPSNATGPRTAEPVLAQLYPTHAGYVAKVRAAVSQAQAAGFLTPTGAASIVQDAETSPIGG